MSHENELTLNESELNDIIQERVREELDEQLNGSKIEDFQERGISRRNFIKKAGLGVLGFTTLLSPISAFDIRDSDGLNVYANGSQNLDIAPKGDVEIPNGNLNIPNGNIRSVNAINGVQVENFATISDLENSSGSPIFGDGSDGEIVRNTDTDESGLYYTTRYEIESGVTCSVNEGVVVIFAQQEVVINGDLDATGKGGSGGAGSQNPGSGGGSDSNGGPAESGQLGEQGYYNKGGGILGKSSASGGSGSRLARNG